MKSNNLIFLGLIFIYQIISCYALFIDKRQTHKLNNNPITKSGIRNVIKVYIPSNIAIENQKDVMKQIKDKSQQQPNKNKPIEVYKRSESDNENFYDYNDGLYFDSDYDNYNIDTSEVSSYNLKSHTSSVNDLKKINKSIFENKLYYKNDEIDKHELKLKYDNYYDSLRQMVEDEFVIEYDGDDEDDNEDIDDDYDNDEEEDEEEDIYSENSCEILHCNFNVQDNYINFNSLSSDEEDFVSARSHFSDDSDYSDSSTHSLHEYLSPITRSNRYFNTYHGYDKILSDIAVESASELGSESELELDSDLKIDHYYNDEDDDSNASVSSEYNSQSEIVNVLSEVNPNDDTIDLSYITDVDDTDSNIEDNHNDNNNKNMDAEIINNHISENIKLQNSDNFDENIIDENNNTEDKKSNNFLKNNLPIILGVSIGCIVIVILVIIISRIYYAKALARRIDNHLQDMYEVPYAVDPSVVADRMKSSNDIHIDNQQSYLTNASGTTRPMIAASSSILQGRLYRDSYQPSSSATSP